MPDAFATQYSEDKEPRCRLCGSRGPLTFEHIPPKRCFNNAPLALRTIRSVVTDSKGLDKFRRGLGTKSLCAPCNGWTGQQYGAAFAGFTTTAMETLDRVATGDQPLLLPFTCVPLRVAKQVAVMAIASSPGYTLKLEVFNRLRWLVANPRVNGPPYGLEFWAYLMRDGQPRLNSMGVPFHIGGSMPFVWCEIALPPMGYVVTVRGLDERRVAAYLGLCSISHFFERDDFQVRTEFLKLRVLSPIGGASLQYEGFSDGTVF